MGSRLRARAALACGMAAWLAWASGCGNQIRLLAPEDVAGHSREMGDEAEGGFNRQGGDGVMTNNGGAVSPPERFNQPGADGEPGGFAAETGFGGLACPKELSVEAPKGRTRAVPAGNGSMEVLVPVEFVKQVLEIGVLEYPDSRILLQQGDAKMTLKKGSREMADGLRRWTLGCAPHDSDGRLYLPLEAVCRGFGYRTEIALESGRMRLREENPYRVRKLPKSYDYRQTGRSTKVRDQGSYGTCWSFASLTALETALRPRIAREFSADHMSLHNSFSLNQRDGGEYTMSMAYLLAWQGPVLEASDPYGDGVSPDGLEPEVHVQEVQILPPKDYEAIKRTVFLHGGVQSSLYTSITGSHSRSVFYNEETSAYCYQGDEIPNHDVVIVGWDDEYPREKFQVEPEGDGAFLCVSSWGERFGDRGYFYVSYYDSNIGGTSLAYTGIEPADHYDRIYQSDLCGWVGQVGYGSEAAYGANVYVAEGEEVLRAAGFYAAGEDTSYEISVVRRAQGVESFKDRKVVASGTVEYGGFYTIALEEPERLEPGERFALVLKAATPGAVHPIAVEYQADDATRGADVTDGESYISPDGNSWEPMEERYQCNLCLKGYTDEAAEDERTER